MSNATHTPGPWAVSTAGDIWIKAGPLHVATIPRAGDGDWSESNARLIAAAPELLEALELALQGLDIAATKQLPEFIGFVLAADKARAAIAKAKGTK